LFQELCQKAPASSHSIRDRAGRRAGPGPSREDQRHPALEPDEDDKTQIATAPPASASSIESILRNATFATAEDMESWPTETGRGGDYSGFTFDEARDARATPPYREEAVARSVATLSLPNNDSSSRIAARGPVQKPSQAVRVVVWRDPMGCTSPPHGTTVTAISVDALWSRSTQFRDLFAWLTKSNP